MSLEWSLGAWTTSEVCGEARASRRADYHETRQDSIMDLIEGGLWVH